MQPLGLSDEELQLIRAAAQPIAPDQRSAFLEEVIAALSSEPVVGVGAIHRAAGDVPGLALTHPGNRQATRLEFELSLL